MAETPLFNDYDVLVGRVVTHFRARNPPFNSLAQAYSLIAAACTKLWTVMHNEGDKALRMEQTAVLLCIAGYCRVAVEDLRLIHVVSERLEKENGQNG